MFPSAHSSRLPHAWNPNTVNLRTLVMPWKRKRCWTADASCRLDLSLTPQYDSEPDLGSPEALIFETRNPARKTDRSSRDSCCRRLSWRTVRAKGSFTTGQACRGISKQGQRFSTTPRSQPRSSALVRELRQGRQPLLWAHRQYLRLGARPLEEGFGCDWRSPSDRQ